MTLDSAFVQASLIGASRAQQLLQQAKNGTYVYNVNVAMLFHAGAT